MPDTVIDTVIIDPFANSKKARLTPSMKVPNSLQAVFPERVGVSNPRTIVKRIGAVLCVRGYCDNCDFTLIWAVMPENPKSRWSLILCISFEDLLTKGVRESLIFVCL